MIMLIYLIKDGKILFLQITAEPINIKRQKIYDENRSSSSEFFKQENSN